MSVSRIGNAYARNLTAAPAYNKTGIVRHIDPIKDWPASRQIAIMRVRRMDWVRPIVTRLEQGTVRAQRHDWRWLKDNHFVTVDKINGWQTTLTGAGIADTLAFHHAGELRMHIFKPSGGQWHEASTRCSCGWGASIRTGAHTQSRIYAAQSSHLTAVENGTFKPIGETLNDLFKKDTG